MKTLRITTHWITEQADDIYQLLDDLKSAIWQSYGEEIVTMHHEIDFEQNNQGEKGDNSEIKDEPFF